MEGIILVEFSHEDWERVLALIEKDHAHRKKMRRKMAKITGRNPRETRARIEKIEFHVIDNVNEEEEDSFGSGELEGELEDEYYTQE